MLKIKTITEKTTKTGKPYKQLEFEDGRKSNMWADHSEYVNVTIGYELDEELVQNGKYLNLTDKKKPLTPPKFIQQQRTAQIEEAQARKSQSISQAQDRSERMWAKNNAFMLLAHHPAFKDLDKTEIMDLARKIVTQILDDHFEEPF